jgi:hypothetical protein
MKQKTLLLAALGTGALGIFAGCAAKTPAGAAATADRAAMVGENARWSANIQSVTQSRADVAQTTRDRSYGSAIWTHGEGPTLTNINIVFTYAGQERYLSWAILAGSCGTPSLPLLPLSNFPELQVGGGGRAQVTSSLPIEFPTTGSYHVDVYRSRQAGMDALIACGNMKLTAS